MTLISSSDIRFHPTSFCDVAGRVFWWQGELYRGINATYADFYQQLFEQGTVARLVEKQLLVPTELTHYQLPDYPLVIKHKRLPFVTYASEWAPEMLRDSALVIADLMLELAKDGLTISNKDGCTWNILFEGGRPLFVDFCTIVEEGSPQHYTAIGYQRDYYSYFIAPLQLMSQGKGYLARWLLSDYEHRAMSEYLECKERQSSTGSQLPWATWNNFQSKIMRKIQRKLQHDPLSAKLALVKRLRQEILAIPLPLESRAALEASPVSLPLTPSPPWQQLQYLVYDKLARYRPETVLTVGSCWYAQLAASQGAQVVALDIDEAKVSRCYLEAAKQAGSLLPLVTDIRYPFPGQGTGSGLLAPARERLACDFVLAISVVHHLALEQYLTLEQISETLAGFAKRWLMVDFFIPAEILPMYSYRLRGYSLERFVKALRSWFTQVTEMPLEAGRRTLLLLEK